MADHRKMDITLLYVEDEAAAREEVSQFLTRRVRTLISASNGEEGLERFRAEHPEFALDPFAHPLTGAPADGALQIWPWEGPGDGMFIVRLRKA